MFTLFFNLYMAMFRGEWNPYSLNDIGVLCKAPLNKIGEIVTSIFNNVDAPISDFGDIMLSNASFTGAPYYLAAISLILALITSIGIVVMAVKGIKKAFGIFFMGIR